GGVEEDRLFDAADVGDDRRRVRRLVAAGLPDDLAGLLVEGRDAGVLRPGNREDEAPRDHRRRRQAPRDVLGAELGQQVLLPLDHAGLRFETRERPIHRLDVDAFPIDPGRRAWTIAVLILEAGSKRRRPEFLAGLRLESDDELLAAALDERD